MPASTHVHLSSLNATHVRLSSLSATLMNLSVRVSTDNVSSSSVSLPVMGQKSRVLLELPNSRKEVEEEKKGLASV